MTTYLLTWNPKKWRWPEKQLADFCRRTAKGKSVNYGWSTGNNRNIVPGDRVFLLRQGLESLGIICSGIVTSHVERQGHWDDKRYAQGKKSNHVDIKFDAIVDPSSLPVLTVKEIESLPVRKYLWRIASGGIEIYEDEAKAIETKWREHLRKIGFRKGSNAPLRLRSVMKMTAARLREGKLKTTTLSVHERNPKARQLCIAHWGKACMVCGMTFEKDYGEFGADYIHVHHLNTMASARGKRGVDPINDLRPVCPNCHAMLHLGTPLLKIDELRAMRRGRLLKRDK